MKYSIYKDMKSSVNQTLLPSKKEVAQQASWATSEILVMRKCNPNPRRCRCRPSGACPERLMAPARMKRTALCRLQRLM